MTVRAKVIIVSVSLLAAFAFGRWSSPEKVKTEIKTVEVEKKTEDTQIDSDKNRHKETKVVEITHPDGTKEKTTQTVEDSQSTKKTDQSVTDNTQKSTEEVKEITYATAKVTISALAGLNVSSLSLPVYGASVTKPILGPITVGLWGLSNSTIGGSIGLTF